LWRYSRDKESRSAWRPWLERAIEDGMPVSWVHPKAIEERLADFERAIQDMRPDQSVWSRFREFLRLVEDGNFAAENAVRLAAYRGSIEEGISRARAASIAKNLTVNWERTGEVGPALATGWAFMNASIQGPARMIRSLVRSRRAQKTAVGLVGAGFAISLLNRLLAWEEEDGENAWAATADWQRERNIAIVIPGQRRFFTIPFTWGWNFFLNLGYQLEDMVNGGKRPLDAGISVAHSAVNAFLPFDTEGSVAQLMAPTVLDPIVAVSENKDWKGSPIRRENYPGQRKPESEMAWDRTGSLMREAGRALNALTGGDQIRPGWIEKLPGHLSSPDTLEHYYEFITGGPGRFLERSMEALSRGFKVPVNNVPIVRRFMMEPPEWGVSQRYFANLREYESIEDSVRYWRREGREPLARNLEDEWRSILRLEQEMKRAERFRKDKRHSEEEVQRQMAEFNRLYRRAKEAREER
jgi:hypothetical protein